MRMPGAGWKNEPLPEPSSDDLQHIRKLATDELITAFECTVVASETPGTLKDAELLARPHLQGDKPFRLALDVRRARSCPDSSIAHSKPACRIGRMLAFWLASLHQWLVSATGILQTH